MTQPLKIYLGDLTYDTIALSTEVFPLNVGYVGAYCAQRFGERVSVRLFKYIEDLDKTLNADPPDILGLSNYCWNKAVGLEMFRMLRDRNPHALTVWGGPNFPADAPSRQALMDRYQELDAYVPIEGRPRASAQARASQPALASPCGRAPRLIRYGWALSVATDVSDDGV